MREQFRRHSNRRSAASKGGCACISELNRMGGSDLRIICSPSGASTVSAILSEHGYRARPMSQDGAVEFHVTGLMRSEDYNIGFDYNEEPHEAICADLRSAFRGNFAQI